jgi:hypothetical protein
MSRINLVFWATGLALVSLWGWLNLSSETALLRVPLESLPSIEGPIEHVARLPPSGTTLGTRLLLHKGAGRRLKLRGHDHRIDLLNVQDIKIQPFIASREPLTFWYRPLACKAVRVESGERLQACRAAQIMAGSKMIYSFDEDLLATRQLRQWYSLCAILPLLIVAAWFVFRARFSDYAAS